MNSSLNRKRRRGYSERSCFEELCTGVATVVIAVMSFFDGVLEFLKSPAVAVIVKGAGLVLTFMVAVGAVGGIETGSITFASALLRIAGAACVSLLMFKAVGDR